MRRLAAVPAATLLVALWTPMPVSGQRAGAGGLLQAYTFDDPQAAGLSDVRLWSTPFAAALGLGRATVDVAGAWARGEVTGPDGGTAVLQGATDTQAALTVGVGDDRLVLRAFAALPTGQGSQSLGESVVAGVMAAELLPFAVTSWGNGGAVGADVAVAIQAGGVGLGLSGGYEAGREFEPLAGETFAYRPGDQVRLRFALDADVGTSGTLSLLLGGQRFSEDALEGTNLFQSGNRLEAAASYAFAVGLRGSGMVYGGLYHRENGTLLVETSALLGATGTPSRQLLLAGANFAVPLGGRATLLPDGEARVYRTGDGIGQGWLASVGAALQLRLAGRRYGRHVVLSPTGRLRLGTVTVRDGVEYGVSGWEVGLTLQAGAGR